MEGALKMRVVRGWTIRFLSGVGLLGLLLGLGSLYSYGAIGGGPLIYVIDTNNNRVVQMDNMTGAGWVGFGISGKGINQLNIPRGIFVDTAGKIYVADFGNSRIVRMDDMTGSGWVTLGAPGKGDKSVFPPAWHLCGCGRENLRGRLWQQPDCADG